MKYVVQLLGLNHGTDAASVRPRTIKKRREQLGLLSSKAVKRKMPDDEKEHLIASAMANDP